jgi:hypothetical protein
MVSARDQLPFPEVDMLTRDRNCLLRDRKFLLLAEMQILARSHAGAKW